MPGFGYPYPIAEYAFTSQGVPMKMAYMDVKAEKPNGHTIVLLYGKISARRPGRNHPGAFTKGYRIIAPDQIGFCK